MARTTEHRRRTRTPTRMEQRVLRIVAVVAIGIGVLTLTVPNLRRSWYDRHGVLTRAHVVRVEPPTPSSGFLFFGGGGGSGDGGDEGDGGDGGDGGGDGGDPTLDVRIDACACIAQVDVATDTHPVGSTVLVRYDPNDPTKAIAVTDPAEPDRADALWAFAIAAFVVIHLATTTYPPKKRSDPPRTIP